jgi:hypothetical protein
VGISIPKERYMGLEFDPPPPERNGEREKPSRKSTSSDSRTSPGNGAFPERIWTTRSNQVVEVSILPLGERLRREYFSIRLYLEDESLPINLQRPTGTASYLEVEVEEREIPSFVRLSGRRVKINSLSWVEKEWSRNLQVENSKLKEEILETKRKLRSVEAQLTFIVTSQRKEEI